MAIGCNHAPRRVGQLVLAGHDPGMSRPATYAPTSAEMVPSESALHNCRKMVGAGSQGRIEDGEEGDLPMNGRSTPRTNAAGAEIVTDGTTPRANAPFTKIVTAKDAFQAHDPSLSVTGLRRSASDGTNSAVLEETLRR
jgi:hypothetical protein